MHRSIAHGGLALAATLCARADHALRHHDHGIYCESARGTLIARNVIADHEHAAWSEYGFAVTQYRAGRRNVVRDNVFHGNASRTDVDCGRCRAYRNVVEDPRFVDPARGNYALRRGSPARAVLYTRARSPKASRSSAGGSRR